MIIRFNKKGNTRIIYNILHLWHGNNVIGIITILDDLDTAITVGVGTAGTTTSRIFDSAAPGESMPQFDFPYGKYVQG